MKKGLIERTGSSGDRRQVSLQLTGAAQALLKESRTGTQQQMEIEIKDLTPQQRKTVTEAMFILRDIFGSAGFYLGAKRVAGDLSPDSTIGEPALNPVDAE